MSQNKIVLLTGASTGIGRATALQLDQLGYTVFAGVRREQDGIDAAIADMNPEGKHLYSKGLLKMQSQIAQAARFGSEPEKVARCIARVISANNPKMQYFVGADARMLFGLARALPISWRHGLLLGQFGS